MAALLTHMWIYALFDTAKIWKNIHHSCFGFFLDVHVLHFFVFSRTRPDEFNLQQTCTVTPRDDRSFFGFKLKANIMIQIHQCLSLLRKKDTKSSVLSVSHYFPWGLRIKWYQIQYLLRIVSLLSYTILLFSILVSHTNYQSSKMKINHTIYYLMTNWHWPLIYKM